MAVRGRRRRWWDRGGDRSDRRDGRDSVDRGDSDRGTATAELAVVLPAVVLLAASGVWAVAAAAAQLRCVDAAGTGARALARGEPTAAVAQAVDGVAPAGAAVSIRRTGGLAVVEVRMTVRLPGPWPGDGPGVLVGDRAVAALENVGAP
jgi:hypothetical protein